MNKVLFVASVVKTHINVFHIPYLKWFKEQGYEVHVAARDDYAPEKCEIPYCDTFFDIPFARFPFKPQNIEAYRRLKRIIDCGEYDIIHCHTPIGGALTRLAAKKARRNGAQVIYTAHGFHFYKGAPLINWLLYYPAEWLLAPLTDVMITINQEDHALAKQRMKAKRVEYVPGVGVDLSKFGKTAVDRTELRRELAIPEDKVWLLAVGELIKRKNHESLIRAIADMPKIYLTIAGQGVLQEHLAKLIKESGLEDRVKLLGFRKDISELCTAADIFALPSYQEGLSVALMEAMACGKPCAVSRIRGNTDLIDERGGVLFDPSSVEDIRTSLKDLMEADMGSMGRYNAGKAKDYSLDAVMARMQEIFYSM